MKKIIMTSAALFAAVSLFAQSSKDRLSELENTPVEESKKAPKPQKESKLLDFDIISEIGYGWHFIKEDQFSSKLKGNKTSNFYFNVFELSLNPLKWASLTLGANLEWAKYVPHSDYYFHGVPDGDSRKLDLTATGAGMDDVYSKLSVFSISVPLGLDIHFGSTRLRAGAEAGFRIKSGSEYSYENPDGDKHSVKDSTPTGLKPFALDYFASLSLGFIGIYVKYYPESISPAIPMNCITAGILLNSR